MRRVRWFAIAGFLAWSGVASADVTVRGMVVDGNGKPLEYVTVAAPAVKRGTMSDTDGRFTLALPEGTAELVGTLVGYQRGHVSFDVVAGATREIRLVLRDEPVALEEVNVRTSSFGKEGKSEGAVLNRMDVYTTPGGAADVFQSLRALPGINAPNEGAALFVRGGDPRETVIRLDGADVGHPYHYEGASGGLFAAFDTYMLKSAFFSSGGFSAKYGGVLSGVLDIETQDPMNTRTAAFGANFAGGNASTSWALVPDKLSIVAAGGLSTTRLLNQLYGTAREYESTPGSAQGAVKLLYRLSPTGRLAFTGLASGDHVAVVSPQLNVRETYDNDAANRFGSLEWSQLVAEKVALKAIVSAQHWTSDWSYSDFGGTDEERSVLAQFDAVWLATKRHEVSFGARTARLENDHRSIAAADSTDLGEGAPTKTIDTVARVTTPGVYVEDKFRLAGPFYATLGARADRLTADDRWMFDPRAAIAWRVDDRQTVRVAGGRYHQAPDPTYLDPVYGNPDLAASAASHVIAGYEWLEPDLNVRVEAYRKTYDDLVTNDAATYYANGGTGYAQGVDVFVKGSHRQLTGWVSYGYLDSRRKELDDPREVPASYGVRHTGTLVAQYRLSTPWSMGTRVSLSSGRPYTPVVGRTYDPSRDLWRPVYGENNSGLMPGFTRVDVRGSYLFSLPAFAGLKPSSVCVAYVEALNVLDIHNTLRYSYSADYSERFAEESYFGRRMLVAGFSLAW